MMKSKQYGLIFGALWAMALAAGIGSAGCNRRSADDPKRVECRTTCTTTRKSCTRSCKEGEEMVCKERCNKAENRCMKTCEVTNYE